MAEPKKETVRIALPPRPEQAGSAPGIVKRDTARIVLPSRTPVTPIRRLPPKIAPVPSTQETESTTEAPRILPRRPPGAPPASTSPLLQPLPKPPGADTDAEPGAPIRPVPPIREEIGSASSVNRGPMKETARISILPRPAAVAPPTINMTKTQPLLIHPTGSAPVAPVVPVVITSKPVVRVDAIPRSLAWTVFGIAFMIFLIQIWNYVVS
jgi:hypothetical protein